MHHVGDPIERSLAHLISHSLGLRSSRDDTHASSHVNNLLFLETFEIWQERLGA